MYIVEVRPAKEIGDYLFNWYYPNIYLVDDSGKEECLSPNSILFEPTRKDLSPSIRSLVFSMIQRQKQERIALKADMVAKLGHDFTVSGDTSIRLGTDSL